MYKQIFILVSKIIVDPRKTWLDLADHKDQSQDVFLKTYLYPIFGIIALFSMLGVFRNEFDIQIALKNTMNMVITVFLGFYVASFLLSELMRRYFNQEKNAKRDQFFIGYASALVYMVYAILAFFPEFFFVKLAMLYSVYIIWEGATSYMEVGESQQVKFTLAASAIVLISPIVVESIMFMIMPGLRI
ncbi:membrane protein [Bacteroidales bacterium]|nr:membrane protein [Bacteroidales bacterium]